jgi:DNA modification methylase
MTTPYYADDKVTLYLGDCREVTEWLAADVLVTDPPYGIGYSAMPTGRGRNAQRSSLMHAAIANDQSFTMAAEVIMLWGSRPMAVFANQENLAVTHAAVSAATKRQRVVTWHKANRTGALGARWLNDVEFAVVGVDKVLDHAVSAVITTRSNVGNPDWQGRGDVYLHPTQKSVGGMEELISACPPGAVADPCAGSGSTLVAARNLGRLAVGVELEERYCEIAARRLAQDCLALGALSDMA